MGAYPTHAANSRVEIVRIRHWRTRYTPPMPESEIAVASDVVIRRLTAADADSLYALIAANRSYLARFMPWCSPAYSLDEARKFITGSSAPEHLENTLAGGIYYRNALAGTVGLRGLKTLDKAGEIGYWLGEPL